MDKKGFTILEILVVISVIAVLIGIAIPRFKGLQDEAKIVKAKAEVRTLKAAVESYKNNNNGALPLDIGAALTTARPLLITSTLYDPFEPANTIYGYAKNTAGTCYVIWANGVNGTSESSIAAGSCDVTCGGDDVCATNGTLQ